MKIGILYNWATVIVKGDETDLICEQEIGIVIPIMQDLLERLGHQVIIIEANLDLWNSLRNAEVDLVFNLAEGFGGKNAFEPTVPAILEALGIPFTGASSYNMNLTLDKEVTKALLSTYGVPCPKGTVVRDFASLVDNFHYPQIVKPVREEASLGIRTNCVVKTYSELASLVSDTLTKYRQPVLIEEFIEGREISVGIVGNGRNIEIFHPLEFLFTEAQSPELKIRSYEYKWGGEKEVMVPAQVSDELLQLLREHSRKAFEVTECRDYARMDFRVSNEGYPYLLEVNYNPGIGPNSNGLNNTLTMMASFSGITFEQLIEKLINGAFERESS